MQKERKEKRRKEKGKKNVKNILIPIIIITKQMTIINDYNK